MLEAAYGRPKDCQRTVSTEYSGHVWSRGRPGRVCAELHRPIATDCVTHSIFSWGITGSVYDFILVRFSALPVITPGKLCLFVNQRVVWFGFSMACHNAITWAIGTARLGQWIIVVLSHYGPYSDADAQKDIWCHLQSSGSRHLHMFNLSYFNDPLDAPSNKNCQETMSLDVHGMQLHWSAVWDVEQKYGSMQHWLKDSFKL